MNDPAWISIAKEYGYEIPEIKWVVSPHRVVECMADEIGFLREVRSIYEDALRFYDKTKDAIGFEGLQARKALDRVLHLEGKK